MPRSHGYNTKTRQLILTYLQDNRRHAVSAANILAYLDENKLPTSPTTVYRYLDKLSSENRVMKYVADKGEKAVYQYVDEGAHCQEHLHLKCLHCGQIYHLDCGFMDEFRDHLLNQHGFTLECSGSMLYGVCASCLEKENAALAAAGKAPKTEPHTHSHDHAHDCGCHCTCEEEQDEKK